MNELNKLIIPKQSGEPQESTSLHKPRYQPNGDTRMKFNALILATALFTTPVSADTLRVQLTDSQGSNVLQPTTFFINNENGEQFGKYQTPGTLQIELPSGRWVVNAKTDSGLAGSVAITTRNVGVVNRVVIPVRKF